MRIDLAIVTESDRKVPDIGRNRSQPANPVRQSEREASIVDCVVQTALEIDDHVERLH